MEGNNPHIVQIGPAVQGKGGIASVIRNILDYPLARHYRITTVPTVESKPDLPLFHIALRSLRRMAKAGDIDLAHVHMASKGSFLRKSIIINMLARHKVSVLVHMHGGNFRRFFDSLGGLGRRYCLRVFSKVHTVVALSEDWVPFFKDQLLVKRICVIPNSVMPPPQVTPDKEKAQPVRFLFLGRLSRHKGIWDLLAAADLLYREHPQAEFHLTLAGDGALEECRAYVAEHGLDDIVSIPGWLSGDNKDALLRNAHVIALPSYAEGCPMALLEGMSFGMSALGSTIPSIAAVVRNEVEGYLVPVDDPQALAAAMLQLVEQDEHRHAMAEKARERVEKHFSPGVISDRLEAVYQTILEDGAKK